MSLSRGGDSSYWGIRLAECLVEASEAVAARAMGARGGVSDVAATKAALTRAYALAHEGAMVAGAVVAVAASHKSNSASATATNTAATFAASSSAAAAATATGVVAATPRLLLTASAARARCRRVA